jgi:hypothetical protein
MFILIFKDFYQGGLGHYGWKSKVKEKMLENVAGEINERLEI